MIRARAKGWITSTAIPTRMIMGVGIITITAIIVTVIAIRAAMRITSMSIVTSTSTIRRIRPVWIKPRVALAEAGPMVGAMTVPPLLLAAAAK